MGDYNASNLRISWHYLHKICEVTTARGAPQSRTPLPLAFALYGGYLMPSRRWDRPQKNLEKKLVLSNINLFLIHINGTTIY